MSDYKDSMIVGMAFVMLLLFACLVDAAGDRNDALMRADRLERVADRAVNTLGECVEIITRKEEGGVE